MPPQTLRGADMTAELAEATKLLDERGGCGSVSLTLHRKDREYVSYHVEVKFPQRRNTEGIKG